MKNIKIILTSVLLLAITACKGSIPDGGYLLRLEPFNGNLNSRAVYVAEVEGNGIGLAISEEEKMLPASTTKIMTALVVLENLGENERLDKSVKVPMAIYEGFNTDDPNTVGSSLSGIEVFQENLTYRNCLYALLMRSGNEAANILAYNLADGSIGNFVKMMNQKAGELGCVNTQFANAHGLYEKDGWSCAYDLSLIAKYTYKKYALFREICMTLEYTMPSNNVFTQGYRIQNGNALVRKTEDNIYYRDFARGVKNGALDEIWDKDEKGEWVSRAGISNLVSIGQVGGKEYIIVTLEAPYKKGELGIGENRLHYAHEDHLTLYDWLISQETTR